MRTPVKLATYGGALVLAFGAALGAGSLLGGPSAPAGDDHSDMDMNGSTMDEMDMGDGSDVPASAAYGGLTVSEGEYTLRLAETSLPAGDGIPLEFQIVGADGEPVTSYEENHDKDMHLIAVRRDASGFQHVHPELGNDGTWRVPLDLTAGVWRIFTDFVTTDENADEKALTLGTDLDVAGNYQPVALPEPSTTAEVDGYTVTLDGELVAGEESELTLSVSQDGRPVTDLEPYLAAYGHLVALRDGDLAYLHVHPAGSPDDGTTEPGPEITFYATAPSVGDYRLFLDFKHGDVVRTAEFTAAADFAGVTASTESDDANDAEHGDSDDH